MQADGSYLQRMPESADDISSQNALIDRATFGDVKVAS
jgi:hypothetical protein